jgi:hypothetical protein
LGRSVKLTESGWAHILFEHYDMINRADAIRITAASAEEIVPERTYAHRDIRYRGSGLGSPWLRVVVHDRRGQWGWVGGIVTAHFVSYEVAGRLLNGY